MTGQRAEAADSSGPEMVVRRSGQGWQVGGEEAADLTSAMVLADLFAAELGSPAPLPEALARKQPPPRKRGRSPRHARAAS